MDSGGVLMGKSAYNPLDMKKIKFSNNILVHTEKALKDVIPIERNVEVVNGNKRVVLINKS